MIPADPAVLAVRDDRGAIARQLRVRRQRIERIVAVAERQGVMTREVIARPQHVIDLADEERLFLLDDGRRDVGVGSAGVAHVGGRIQIEDVETGGVALLGRDGGQGGGPLHLRRHGGEAGVGLAQDQILERREEKSLVAAQRTAE